MGTSDLHTLRVRDERMYAYDLARDRLVVTDDFGRTWGSHRPPGLILDLAIDPGQPQRLLASSTQGLVVSIDSGATWRPLSAASRTLLAWRKAGALNLIDETAVVSRSRDGGASKDVVDALDSA